MKEVLDFVNFDFHLPVTDPTWIFFLVLVVILFWNGCVFLTLSV